MTRQPFVMTLFLSALSSIVSAQSQAPRGQQWTVSWAASAHGPYPSGNPSAQPALDLAFESAGQGAIDQTFRLIVRPDLWGSRVRLRFSNAFGTRPVTLDGGFVGVQAVGGTIVNGTNQPVTFGGRDSLTLQPGTTAFSDAVALPFVGRADRRVLTGRKLAVSFHAVGSTGPMTWHAKALQTSYVTAPGAGKRGDEESDAAFPFTTTSWFFLDALDVLAPAGTAAVVAFGDSITDGTASTLNGDDRWPDVLSRRLHAAYGDRISVVNAGIGGNRVTSPAEYSPTSPFAGGPSALDRLERDVLSLSGASSVIWLEGINDFSAGASADDVIGGLKRGVARMRARNLRVIGATITSSVGSAGAAGNPAIDMKRQAVNTFIRTAGLYDGVADFDAATRDGATGGLRAIFVPNSTIGGAGDRLHPNRAGYQAMAESIDVALLAPRLRR